jgi:hypothetical protein
MPQKYYITVNALIYARLALTFSTNSALIALLHAKFANPSIAATLLFV